MTIDYAPITPPGRLHALQELRLPIDMLRWAPTWLAMKSRRATRPRTAILLPGFGAGPRSMRVMESFLRRRGHRARDWGLGMNTGDARRLRAELKLVVEQSIAAHGETVVLVGWSLGGYIAREYAREHPDEVRRVVTLGSPVIGGPRYTAVAEWYRSRGHDLAALAQRNGRAEWVQSFVTDEKTFCIYLAEDDAAIHEHARISGFPASKVTEIGGIIDPSTAA